MKLTNVLEVLTDNMDVALMDWKGSKQEITELVKGTSKDCS